MLLILLPLVVGGCGLFGALYGALIDPFIPTAKVAAQHDMSEKKVLIWVDDAYLAQPHHLLRRELTNQLASNLRQNQAVADLVDYSQMARFRQTNPNYADQTIQQLGRQMQADEVLYIMIDKFQLQHQAGKGFYRPQLSGYSKVIDVATGNRLWPVDQSRRPFSIGGQLTEGQGQIYEDKQVKELSKQLVEIIAPSFYEHRPSRKSDDNT
jgi:hypothetical protein